MFDSAALAFWPWGLIVGKFVLLFFLQLSLYIWNSGEQNKQGKRPCFLLNDQQMRKLVGCGWALASSKCLCLFVVILCNPVSSHGDPRCLQSIFWNSGTTFLIVNCSSYQKLLITGCVWSTICPWSFTTKIHRIGRSFPSWLGIRFSPYGGWW